VKPVRIHLTAQLVFIFERPTKRGAIRRQNEVETALIEVATAMGVSLGNFIHFPEGVAFEITYPATASISKLVNSIKLVSARKINQSHGAKHPKFWRRGYRADSVGKAGEPAIKEYIRAMLA